jgi:hypothetical protein
VQTSHPQNICNGLPCDSGRRWAVVSHASTPRMYRDQSSTAAGTTSLQQLLLPSYLGATMLSRCGGDEPLFTSTIRYR